MRLGARDDPWRPTSADSSPEISYANCSANINQSICGSSPSESEQQTANILFVQSCLQGATPQQSPTTIPLATQTSPDISHPQYTSPSPIYTNQTSQTALTSQASPLNVATLQQVLPRTLPASPVVSTPTVLQEVSSSSARTLANIHLPQQIFLNSSHAQALAAALEFGQMLASTGNADAVREMLFNAVNRTSGTVSHHGNGSTANVDSSSLNSIDAALKAAGVIDEESQNLASKMPELSRTIERLAQILGFQPVDLLHKILSPDSPPVHSQ